MLPVPALQTVLLLGSTFFPPALPPDPEPGSAVISPATDAPDPLSPQQKTTQGWFRPFVRNEAAIWTSPLRLKKSDARWLIPFAMATGALIASDASIAAALPNTSRQVETGQALSRIGAAYTVAGIAGSMYLVGRFAGNPRARETGSLGAQAFLHSLIVTQVLKAATGRERPEDGNGRGQFFEGRVSFPSGHSMMAWSLAAVIAHEYQDRKSVRYGAYAAALAVNAGRMMANKHFASDCLVGGVFGYAIGTFLYNQRQREKRGSTSGTSHIPLIGPQFDRTSRTYGVSLAWQF